jgi:hypothetical protein
MKNDDRAPNPNTTFKRSVLVMGALCTAFVASSAGAQEAPQTNTTATTGPGAPIAPLPATSVDLSAPTDAPPVIVAEHRFLNRKLFVSGLVLFGGTYTASMIVGAESSRDQDHKDLFYPVVGPWMDIGHRDCGTNTCTNEAGAVTLLILDGIGQGVGILAIIASVAIPERITRKYFLGSEKLSVTPMRMGLAAYGLGAHGSF